MGRKAFVEPHHSVAELERLCKVERDPELRDRFRFIWFLRSGRCDSASHAGERVGMSQPTSSRWLRAYNALGERGLHAKPKGRKFNGPISGSMLAEIGVALELEPPEEINGGVWDGPKVAQFIFWKWGIVVSRQAGWYALKRLGYSVQTPRPRHVGTPTWKKEEFKKNST